MKIDLAVWTAVNGYDWQPGSVYSPKELAGYKDEIGPLVPDSLPLGGLFLKERKAVFYRVQIAERMDSRGRGAIYCVLGAVPEDRAKGIDFSDVFNSDEMAQPQKPFPKAIEYSAEVREFKLPLGHVALDEKRFTGVETFSELGGWCEEAKGGKLNVKISGSVDAPLFTVNYNPRVEHIVVPPKPPPPQSQIVGCCDLPNCQPCQQPSARQTPDPSMADLNNQPFNRVEKPAKTSYNQFLNGFVAGIILGMVIPWIVVWLFRLPKNNDANAGYKPMPHNSSAMSQQAIEKQTENHRGGNRECSECDGQGKVKHFWIMNDEECTSCSGTGYIQK